MVENEYSNWKSVKDKIKRDTLKLSSAAPESPVTMLVTSNAGITQKSCVMMLARKHALMPKKTSASLKQFLQYCSEIN